MPIDPDSPTYALVSAVLRALAEQHITQSELAEVIGKHHTTVSAIRHGRQRLSFDNAVRIADALHINLADVDNAWRK